MFWHWNQKGSWNQREHGAESDEYLYTTLNHSERGLRAGICNDVEDGEEQVADQPLRHIKDRVR